MSRFLLVWGAGLCSAAHADDETIAAARYSLISRRGNAYYVDRDGKRVLGTSRDAEIGDVLVSLDGRRACYRFWRESPHLPDVVPRTKLTGTPTKDPPMLVACGVVDKAAWIAGFDHAENEPGKSTKFIRSWQATSIVAGELQNGSHFDKMWINLCPVHQWLRDIDGQWQRESLLTPLAAAKSAERVTADNRRSVFEKFGVTPWTLDAKSSAFVVSQRDHPWQYLVAVDEHALGLERLHARDFTGFSSHWPYLFPRKLTVQRSEDKVLVSPDVFTAEHYAGPQTVREKP